MRRLYSVLISCAAPGAFLWVLWRSMREPEYRVGLGERFGRGGTTFTHPSLWLHAVSMGEMAAAAPVIRALRQRFPDFPVALTTATPAGRARAKSLFPDLDVRFLPYDTPAAMRRFLSRVRPRIAVIMETELWPNLFDQCAQRGIPVVLASARLSAKSVARYSRFGALFRRLFTSGVIIAAQSMQDGERFRSIGAAAANVRLIGNVKFDLQLDPDSVAQAHELRASLGSSRPIWIAGSTHAGEEEFVLGAHARLLADHPNALLLLAPRHRDRFAAVAQLLARHGMSFVKRSEQAEPDAATQVVLVDTLGELARLYAAADVAFVGGSLVPIGGHNLLEPAALGIPVLTGPFNANGTDIAQGLLLSGAALEVSAAQDMADALRRWFDDPVERRRIGGLGKQMVAANRGSVARLLDLIAPLLSAARP